MKYLLSICAAALVLTSCKNTWDSETKDMFRQSCIEEATWATPEVANKYCDCVLEKTMAKYPKFEDAMTHVDSVITDPAIQQCKADAQTTAN